MKTTRRHGLFLALAATVWLAGCASSRNTFGSAAPSDDEDVFAQGRASWYGGKFHGRRTASGERFDKYALTAAHRSLPFGTQVLVRNMRNGREVVVRINDRGPSSKNRIIDISRAAAEAIGLVEAGVAEVQLSKP